MARASFAFIPLAWSLVVLPNAGGTSDVSGQWTMEYRQLHTHETYVYTISYPNKHVETQEYVNNNPWIAEIQGFATQSNGRIQGTLCFGDEYAGDYTFEGDVSNNNVTFKIVLPGETRDYTRIADHGYTEVGHRESGAETTLFMGVYDPEQKGVKGKFKGTGEPSSGEYTVYDTDGSVIEHGSIRIENENWEGDFTIEVVKPWILIPGWAHRSNVWDAFKGFLDADGTPYAEADLPQYGEPNANAKILAFEIDIIREREAWQGEVCLVAHSQGGLDARACLRDLGNSATEKVSSLTIQERWRNSTRGLPVLPM